MSLPVHLLQFSHRYQRFKLKGRFRAEVHKPKPLLQGHRASPGETALAFFPNIAGIEKSATPLFTVSTKRRWWRTRRECFNLLVEGQLSYSQWGSHGLGAGKRQSTYLSRCELAEWLFSRRTQISPIKRSCVRACSMCTNSIFGRDSCEQSTGWCFSSYYPSSIKYESGNMQKNIYTTSQNYYTQGLGKPLNLTQSANADARENIQIQTGACPLQ